MFEVVNEFTSNRRNDYESWKYLGRIGYSIEYNTLSLGLPRRSGKTQYIIDHAEPWDLVFAHNGAMIDYFKRRINQHTKVMYIQDVILQNLRGCNYYLPGPYLTKATYIPRTIWFDEIYPDRYREQLRNIYDIFAHDINQRFIFLGTPVL